MSDELDLDQSVAGEEDPGASLDVADAVAPAPTREGVCPHCRGSGRAASGVCPVCGGTGKVAAGIGDA